jgi:hypothetical protein
LNHECNIEYKIAEEIGRWLILHAPDLISPELHQFTDLVKENPCKWSMFKRRPPNYGYGKRLERDPETKKVEVVWHNPYPYKDTFTEEF